MKQVIKTLVSMFPGNEYCKPQNQIIRIYSDNTVKEEIFDTNGKLLGIWRANKSYYNLYLFGIENAKKARSFIGNSCVRGIYDHGKRIAQIEDVLEDLIFVGYIENSANVEKVIENLFRLGFTGLCEIEENWEDIYQETICAIKI